MIMAAARDVLALSALRRFPALDRRRRSLFIRKPCRPGLPVVITPNTGARLVSKARPVSLLVPIRSPEAIAAKLPLTSTGRAGGDEAQAALPGFNSWQRYSETIGDASARRLSGSPPMRAAPLHVGAPRCARPTTLLGGRCAARRMLVLRHSRTSTRPTILAKSRLVSAPGSCCFCPHGRLVYTRAGYREGFVSCSGLWSGLRVICQSATLLCLFTSRGGRPAHDHTVGE